MDDFYKKLVKHVSVNYNEQFLNKYEHIVNQEALNNIKTVLKNNIDTIFNNLSLEECYNDYCKYEITSEQLNKIIDFTTYVDLDKCKKYIEDNNKDVNEYTGEEYYDSVINALYEHLSNILQDVLNECNKEYAKNNNKEFRVIVSWEYIDYVEYNYYIYYNAI